MTTMASRTMQKPGGYFRRTMSCCSSCAKVRLGLNVVRSGVGALGAHRRGTKDRRPQFRDARRALQARKTRSQTEESLTRAKRAGGAQSLRYLASAPTEVMATA